MYNRDLDINTIKFIILLLNFSTYFTAKISFLDSHHYYTPLHRYQWKALYMHERTISCRMFAPGRPRRIVTQGLYLYPKLRRNSPLRFGSGLMVFIVHQDRRISVRCEHGNTVKRALRVA